MPNIEISDLPSATLPLSPLQSFFEVQTVEAGEDVSRKISANDISINLPDGTVLGSIMVLSAVIDTYVNNEQVIADGVNVLLNTTQVTMDGVSVLINVTQIVADGTSVNINSGEIVADGAGTVTVNTDQVIADGTNVFLRDTTHTGVGANLSTFLEGISVATELAAADNTVTALRGGVRLQDLDGVTTLATFDFQNAVSAGALLLRNATEGGFISLRATATAGSFGDRTVFEGDPDGASTMFNLGVARALTTASGMTINAGGSLGLVTLFATSSVASFYSQYNGTNGGVALKNQNPDARLVQISTGGGEEDVWIDMERDGLVGLRHNDVQMARTVIAASGGLEVNNTVTGAGFERALTTADLFGGAFNDLSDVIITTPANFQSLRFDGSDWVNSSMLQITGVGTTMGGMTLGITGAQVRGRFTNAGESGGSTQTTVSWSDDDGSQVFGEIEWRTTGGGSDGDAMYFRNRRHGGNIEFEGEDVSGNLRRAFTFDPDVSTSIFHAPSNAIVWRSVTPAAGSMEIDNQSTGAGFERVLTTADLTGGAFGNLQLQANEIISTDTNGNVEINPDGTGEFQAKFNSQVRILADTNAVRVNSDLTGVIARLINEGPPGFDASFTQFADNGGHILVIDEVAGVTEFRQTSNVGAIQDNIWQHTRDGEFRTYHNGLLVTRTLTSPNGSLEINNSLTGVGFRRVLTEADALTDTLTSDTSIPGVAFVTILTVRAEANRNYAITGMILLDVPLAADDSSWRFTLPTSATGEVQWMGFDEAGAAHFRTTEGGLFSSNDDGGTSFTSYALTGMLRIVGTAGDVDIDIAKLADAGGDALAKEGSWIKLVPVEVAP